jgi:hypothetical protein
MYLGTRSITLLETFMLGYKLACDETIGDVSVIYKLSRFRVWLGNKYSITETYGWSHLLLEVCKNNEDEAFELFVRNWNEFCELPSERKTDLYDEKTPKEIQDNAVPPISTEIPHL